MVKHSTEAELYANYSPAIALIDFIVYVLSTTSFWLGVSPLSIMSDTYENIVRGSTVTANQGQHQEQIRRLKLELYEQKQTICTLNEQIQKLNADIDKLSGRLESIGL